MATEAEGTDFLNMGMKPVTTDDMATVVDALCVQLGTDVPKKDSDEQKSLTLRLIKNALSACSKLTGNKMENCALCVDYATIKNWKIGANPKVPQYPLKGNSAHVLFIQFFGDCYDEYIVEKKEKLEKATKMEGSDLMDDSELATTSRDKMEKTLAVGVRFCCQYWCLHPKKTRMAAFTEAMTLLNSECNNRLAPKRIIDDLHARLKMAHMIKELSSLKVERTGDRHTCLIEEDNDRAAVVIPEFLDFCGFKWKKNEYMTPLFALQAYIQKQSQNSEVYKNLGKMLKHVPRQTEEYLKLVQEKQAKEAKAQEAAAKKIETAEKKRKREEEKKALNMMIQGKALGD